MRSALMSFPSDALQSGFELTQRLLRQVYRRLDHSILGFK